MTCADLTFSLRANKWHTDKSEVQAIRQPRDWKNRQPQERRHSAEGGTRDRLASGPRHNTRGGAQQAGRAAYLTPLKMSLK